MRWKCVGNDHPQSGIFTSTPEHCDSRNELAPATKVRKAEGAISRLQQKTATRIQGWADGEAGSATDFQGLPSSARGFLFPSDQSSKVVTHKSLGFKARKA